MGAYIFWACFLASLKIKQRSKKAEAFCWLLGSINLIVIFLQVFIWMLLLFVQVSFIQRVGYDGVQKKKKCVESHRYLLMTWPTIDDIHTHQTTHFLSRWMLGMATTFLSHFYILIVLLFLHRLSIDASGSDMIPRLILVWT